MQAYEGYFEDGRFTPIGKSVNIRGRRRVRLTVLDEPTQLSIKDQELRAEWLKKLDAAIDLSMGEEFHDVPRSAIMRKPINLTDEG
jgi:hypothetical protein